VCSVLQLSFLVMPALPAQNFGVVCPKDSGHPHATMQAIILHSNVTNLKETVSGHKSPFSGKAEGSNPGHFG
jgi:hypothetical protein